MYISRWHSFVNSSKMSDLSIWNDHKPLYWSDTQYVQENTSIIKYGINCSFIPKLQRYNLWRLGSNLISHIAGHMITYPCWYLWNMMRLYEITGCFYTLRWDRACIWCALQMFQDNDIWPWQKYHYLFRRLSIMTAIHTQKNNIRVVGKEKNHPVGNIMENSISKDVAIIHSGLQEMTGILQQMLTNVERCFVL